MRAPLPGRPAGHLLMIATGAVFAAGALLRLDPGTARHPGPGALPLFAGLALVLLGCVSIVIEFSRSPTPLPIDARATGMVALGIGGFALLTPAAGVLPATFVAALCATLATRTMSWRRRIVFSAAVVPAVWLLFFRFLDLPLVAVSGL